MSFSFNTVIAKIKNFFNPTNATTTIKALETAVSADYTKAVTAAENAYADGIKEVRDIAHTEAARIEALLQAAKARAASLIASAEHHLHPTVAAQVTVTASLGETVH